MEKMAKIEISLLNFLENDEETDITKIINYLMESINHENIHELNSFFHLISHISNNHHRTTLFTSKIFQIFSAYKNDLIKNFTNYEIFTMFKQNKLILLFLFNQKILIPDKFISDLISMGKYKQKKYPHFFLPEFKQFFSDELCEQISKESENCYQTDPEIFNQKREKGDNDNDICQLIQNDSIEDFIEFVSRHNISLSNSTITPSIFETNPLLMKKQASLIEYSAFYGSINIFYYLYNNKVPLTPSLWLFSIHGKNPEIIQILEENKIKPDESSKSYEKAFIEVLKCHQINMKKYFIDHFISEINENVIFHIVKFFNYESFPSNFDGYFKIDFIIKSKNFPLFQLIHKYQEIDLNTIFEISDLTFSILHYSILCDNIELFHFLLKQPNINVNVKTLCERSERPGNFQYIIKTENIETPLNYAIRNLQIEFIFLLLKCPKIDVNVISDYIDNYFKNGINYRKNSIEASALHVSILLKQKEIVKILLETPGIDVKQKCIEHLEYEQITKNVIHLAIEANAPEILEILIRNPDINVNEKLTSKRHSSINFTNGEIDDDDDDENIYYGKNYKKYNEITDTLEESTPLCLATQNNCFEIVRILLSCKEIDVNAESNKTEISSKVFKKSKTPTYFFLNSKSHGFYYDFSFDEFDNEVVGIEDENEYIEDESKYIEDENKCTKDENESIFGEKNKDFQFQHLSFDKEIKSIEEQFKDQRIKEDFDDIHSFIFMI